MGHYDSAYEYDAEGFAKQQAKRDSEAIKIIETEVADLVKTKGLVRALAEIVYHNNNTMTVPWPETYK